MLPFSAAARIFLSPQRLVDHLHLYPLFRVLGVKPRTWPSSASGGSTIPQGRLVLADIQLEMLQMARRRLRRAGVRNASYTQANTVTLPFRAGAFDVTFLVAVLGEVPDPKACLSSIADALRPGALLSVAELPGDPDALTEEQLRTLTQGTGLEFAESVRVSRVVLASFRRQVVKPRH